MKIDQSHIPLPLKITLSDDSYWTLIETKTKMRCRTWKELIDKLHTESQPGTSRLIRSAEERR